MNPLFRNALFEDIAGQPDSLERVLEHLAGAGLNSVARAAAEMRHAPKILFTGMGSSLFAAMPSAALLNSRGRGAATIEAAELLHFHRSLDRLTLAVVISRSGETVEVVKLLPLLKERGIHIVGVTNVPESTLGSASDILVHVNSDQDRMVALRTYTGTVAALLALTSTACGAPAEDVSRLPDEMRQLIADEMAGDRIPAADSQIYLLGRGASLSSVAEGALLFHEAARTSAVGMSCGQFRHGPVEAVTQKLYAYVFASQPETRMLDERLAADVRSLGGNARVVTPGCAGPWACVLEIIPIQIAAAKLAERKGIPAGVFQFAPQVTTEETGFLNGRE